VEGTADEPSLTVGVDMSNLLAAPIPAPSAQIPAPPPARRFAASLRELTSSRGVDEILQLAVDLATEIIPCCDLADVMLLAQGRVTTPVGTHPLAGELDQIQEAVGEGPCLLPTLDEEPTIYVGDLATNPRWPVFGPRAAATGVRSVISYGLYLGSGRTSRLGAMNLYSHRPQAFDAVSIHLGGVLVESCATAVNAEIDRDGLCRALDARSTIGRAKYIVMDTHLASASRALTLLRERSREHGLSVHDVACHVATTGQLP
jgi:hypothetical protein